MIKRHYFYSVRYNWNDGKKSYSYECGTLTHTSWLPNIDFLWDSLTKQAIKKHGHKSPTGTIEFLALNRI